MRNAPIPLEGSSKIGPVRAISRSTLESLTSTPRDSSVFVERLRPGPAMAAITTVNPLDAMSPKGNITRIRLMYWAALLLRMSRPMLVVMAANKMGRTHIFSRPI